MVEVEQTIKRVVRGTALGRVFAHHVREALRRRHDTVRDRELRETRVAIGADRLARDLRRAGIAAGDVVYLFSSLKSVGYVEGGAETVLSALTTVLTAEGTLMVPTFHMPGGSMLSACRTEGYVFDPSTAGTSLGAIPRAFLGRPGVHRSLHPTHSVGTWGRHARFLTEAHPRAASTFGKDSPFERLCRLEGKILGIGVSVAPITLYHTVEDTMGSAFPLRVHVDRTYAIPCRTTHGALVSVEVRPLEPSLADRRIDHPGGRHLRTYFHDALREAGLLEDHRIGEATSWTVPARGCYRHLVALAERGATIYSGPEVFAARSMRDAALRSRFISASESPPEGTAAT